MAMSRGQHLIGKEIGSCVLEKLLGYGGSSAVFLAQQHGSDQKVAIKVFLPRSTMTVQMQKDFYTRFLREAEAASELDHPNILPIYSYGEQHGLPYIIMPYMPGGTLREYIASHGCLSLTEAQWYLEQIASALDYAHEHGCVHCDVKPANILLDADGNVMLSDFGIAHLMHPASENNHAHQHDQLPQPLVKSTGMLMGTPDYISPEQALGQPLDGRSDVYSLGITLFFLLAGRLPFRADSMIAVALLHVHEPPPALSLLRGDIVPETDRVIQKALAKRPEARYQTTGEFSAAFAQAVAKEGIIHTIDQRGPHALQISGSSSAKHALLNAKPMVRIKPASQSRVNVPRAVTIISILLFLALSAALLGGLLAARLTSGGPPDMQITVPANALVDGLQNSDDWPTGGTFFFTGTQYHIQNRSAHNVALALYANHTYVNFRLTVTMAELHGTADGADYYGIAFRGSPDQSHYYLFELSDWDGGQFQCLRYDGDSHWTTLAGGPTPAPLHTNSKPNTLTIEAHGHTFKFWINTIAVRGSFTDTQSTTSLSSGEVGFSVEEQGTEVAFSHLYIQSLP